jgi:hypothetical protein
MERTFKVVSNKVPVKCYTIGELATLYDLTVKAFRTLLKPHQPFIGKRVGRYYTCKQVLIIFDRIDLPGYAED